MRNLKRQEPIGAGLQRIACESIEAGVRALTRQADQAELALQAIHEAAGALALLEPALPRATARRDRALVQRLRIGLGEIAGPAAVHARLEARCKKTPAEPPLATAVKAIRKRSAGPTRTGSALNSRGGSFDPAIYRLVADMAELRGHAGEWPVAKLDDTTPLVGLGRSYARAKRLAHGPKPAGKARRGGPATNPPQQPPQHLPELAAALRTLVAQLGILAKACPPMIKAQRKLIDRAAQQLDTQLADLALDAALREQLAIHHDADAAALLQSPAPDTSTIDGLHAALAETPAAFRNRLLAYWSAWRSGNTA